MSKDSDRLARLTTDTASKTDSLNETIYVLEERLRRAQLGVHARVEASSFVLLFCKHESGWRICVDLGRGEEPLLNAARAIRIIAAVHLQELVNRVVSNAKTQLSDLEEAVRIARSVEVP